MVRPASFGFNPESAATNRFQHDRSDDGNAHETAIVEFDGMVTALRSEGIQVCVVEDAPVPRKPDAVFPNNWLSWHADGTLVLYPMQPASRRPERSEAVIAAVVKQCGFEVKRRVDLTMREREQRYLEGTGSLVLDHINRLAYACRSARTDEALTVEWCDLLGYTPMVFDAADAGGVPYYHTNVMLWIGERVACVATEAIAAADRRRVHDSLATTGRHLIELSRDDIAQFAGNMLELASWDEALGDCRVIVMSATAQTALGAERLARLAACTDAVLAVPVPAIERYGGGSVRCMLAEVFLR